MYNYDNYEKDNEKGRNIPREETSKIYYELRIKKLERIIEDMKFEAKIKEGSMGIKKLGIARIIDESDIIKVQNSLNVDRDSAIEYLEKTEKEWITESIILAIREKNLIEFTKDGNKIIGTLLVGMIADE